MAESGDDQQGGGPGPGHRGPSQLGTRRRVRMGAGFSVLLGKVPAWSDERVEV